MIDRGEMDLAVEFAVPLPMMVIAEMIGIPAADWPRFRGWSDAILKLSYTRSGDEDAAQAFGEFRATTAEMNDYLTEMIAERRAAPRDDLLTRLVAAEVDGERLEQEEILGFFQLLVVGGQETTANLINNAILCLLENPDQLARLGRRRAVALGDRGGPAVPLAALVDDAHADARRRAPRPIDTGRGTGAADDRRGESRPRGVPRRRPLRHHARPQPAHRLRARDPRLPGLALARWRPGSRCRTCWSASRASKRRRRGTVGASPGAERPRPEPPADSIPPRPAGRRTGMTGSSTPAGRSGPGHIPMRTTSSGRGDHRPHIFMPVPELLIPMLMPLSPAFVSSAGIAVLVL